MIDLNIVLTTAATFVIAVIILNYVYSSLDKLDDAQSLTSFMIGLVLVAILAYVLMNILGISFSILVGILFGKAFLDYISKRKY